jgi:hypothetical protein
MASMFTRLSPSITTMIRMDHTHVLAAFHQYQQDTPARVKKGLADNICLALEVHAQLEEEIFYPALREVSPDAVLDKAKPEHDQMREHIQRCNCRMRFIAMPAAAVRVSTPSLAKIRSRCFFTVAGLEPRMSAMSRLILPLTTQYSTSASRAVSLKAGSSPR